MSRTAQRLAVLAVGGLLVATLTGCVGRSIEAATDAVVAELTQLPGVADGQSLTGEPTLLSSGASAIQLDLDPGISPDELEDVVRRWAELAPDIPISNRLRAELPEGHSLEIEFDAELEVAVSEAGSWLSISARVAEARLSILGPNSANPTWSRWTVALDGPATGLEAAVAGIRSELEERGQVWDLTASGPDEVEVEVRSTVEFPPAEAFAVIADLAAATDPAVGARAIEASWRTATDVHSLDVRVSLEPPDFTDIPSNELNDNVPGSAAEAYAVRLRDTLPTPAVPTQIAVRVFDAEDFLTFVLP